MGGSISAGENGPTSAWDTKKEAHIGVSAGKRGNTRTWGSRVQTSGTRATEQPSTAAPSFLSHSLTLYPTVGTIHIQREMQNAWEYSSGQYTSSSGLMHCPWGGDWTQPEWFWLRETWKQENPCEKRTMGQQVCKGKSKTKSTLEEWKDKWSSTNTNCQEKIGRKHRVSNFSCQSKTQGADSTRSQAMSQEGKMQLTNHQARMRPCKHKNWDPCRRPGWEENPGTSTEARRWLVRVLETTPRGGG